MHHYGVGVGHRHVDAGGCAARAEAFPGTRRQAHHLHPERIRSGRLPAAGRTAVDNAFRIVHTGYLHTELGQRQRGTGPVAAALGRLQPRGRHPHALARVSPRGDRPVGRAQAGASAASRCTSQACCPTPIARSPTVPGGATPRYLPRRVAAAGAISGPLCSCRCQNLPAGNAPTPSPGKTSTSRRGPSSPPCPIATRATS